MQAGRPGFWRRNALSLGVLVLAGAWLAYQQLPLYLESRALAGRPMPNGMLRSLDDGQPLQLAQFAGRPLLINFWATWCAPCIAEIPLLNDSHDRWKDKGLVILGVTNESPRTIREFRKRHEIRYPIALDPMGAVGKTFRVRVFPTLVFVNRNGEIEEVSHGFSPLLRWKVNRLVGGSFL